MKNVMKPKRRDRGDDGMGDWEVVEQKRETYKVEPINSDSYEAELSDDSD